MIIRFNRPFVGGEWSTNAIKTYMKMKMKSKLIPIYNSTLQSVESAVTASINAQKQWSKTSSQHRRYQISHQKYFIFTLKTYKRKYR